MLMHKALFGRRYILKKSRFGVHRTEGIIGPNFFKNQAGHNIAVNEEH